MIKSNSRLNKKMQTNNISYYIHSIFPSELPTKEQEKELLKENKKYRKKFLNNVTKNINSSYKISRDVDNLLTGNKTKDKTLFKGDYFQKERSIQYWEGCSKLINKIFEVSLGLENLLSHKKEYKNQAIKTYGHLQEETQKIMNDSNLNEWHLMRIAKNYVNNPFPIQELDYNKEVTESYKKYKETKDEIFINFSRLVWSIAKKYKKFVKGTSNLLAGQREEDIFLELVDEGNIGLLEAIDRYNLDIAKEKNSNRFSTYATHWVKNLVLGKLNEMNKIYRNWVPRVRKLESKLKEFESKNGKKPSDKELADFMGTNKKEIKKIKNNSGINTFSLNAVLSKEEKNEFNGTEFIDFVEPDDENLYENYHKKKEIHNILQKRLSSKEYNILSSLFLEGKTLNAVGEEYNLTRERIRQIKEKVLGTLKHSKDLKKIKDYLYKKRNSKKKEIKI